MPEFFIQSNSFAAPFFSDSATTYVEAPTAAAALEKYASDYKHPAGLYAALAYESADALHKGSDPLAKWLCNHEQEKARLTKDLGSFMYMGHGPGDFEIDHKRHKVENPKGGSVVAV